MGKIDRKRTRCCGKYVCMCTSKATFEQKYPWKDASNSSTVDKYHKKGDADVTRQTDSRDRRMWVDGRMKKTGLRKNKLRWD